MAGLFRLSAMLRPTLRLRLNPAGLAMTKVATKAVVVAAAAVAGTVTKVTGTDAVAVFNRAIFSASRSFSVGKGNAGAECRLRERNSVAAHGGVMRPGRTPGRG